MKKLLFSSLIALSLLPATIAAPALEDLFPAETVFLAAFPDYAAAERDFDSGVMGRLWNSTEMRSFREKLEKGFEDNLLGNIEERFGIEIDAFEEIANGPVAFAIVQGKTPGEQPAFLLLIDAGKKTFTLGRTISRLERDWKRKGRKVGRTTLGSKKFTTLIGASGKEVLHLGREKGLFFAGTDTGILEEVLERYSGKGTGSLSTNPIFASDKAMVLEGADAYVWADFSQVLPQLISSAPDGTDLGLNIQDILNSLGLDGFKSMAAAFQEQKYGASFDIFIGLPEEKRTGFLGLLEMKRIDSAPNEFVSADAQLFQRWRIDIAATWSNLEKLLNDTAPDIGSMVEFTVNLLGKDKDQNFDFKKSFFNNLGDDIILYQLEADMKNQEAGGLNSLLGLVSTPNPDELIKAIGAIPGILPPPLNEATMLPRRLGEHSVYSFDFVLDSGAGDDLKTGILFGAKDGYLVWSTNPNLLQLHLDGSPTRALSSRAGLFKAAEQVGGLKSGFFGYLDGPSSIQHVVSWIRETGILDVVYSAIVMDDIGEADPGGWLDFSLLPSDEKIGKFFDFAVFGLEREPQGITLKYFSPTPTSKKPR
ncbi:MAG: hypothetical protein QF731_06880 [Verrucomicrobiota bacterium]|nr:hypothetical protein [Verrucomicrobiota bacterium]